MKGNNESAALRLAASNLKDLKKAKDRIIVLENLLGQCVTKIEYLSLHYRFGLFLKLANIVLNERWESTTEDKSNNISNKIQ